MPGPYYTSPSNTTSWYPDICTVPKLTTPTSYITVSIGIMTAPGSLSGDCLAWRQQWWCQEMWFSSCHTRCYTRYHKIFTPPAKKGLFVEAFYEESESFDKSAAIQRGDEILVGGTFSIPMSHFFWEGRAKCRGPIIPRQFQGCQISTRIFTEFGNTPETWTLESEKWKWRNPPKRTLLLYNAGIFSSILEKMIFTLLWMRN